MAVFENVRLPIPLAEVRSVGVGRSRRRPHLELREAGGRRHRVYLGVQSVRHAERLAARLREAIAAGVEAGAVRTLSEFEAEILAWISSQRREKTFQKYRTALRQFQRVVPGIRPLREIERSDLLRFATLRGGEVTGRTVNNQVRDLRALFNHAIRLGYLERNPAAGIPRATEEGTARRVLEPEEDGNLLAGARKAAGGDPWLERVIRFALGSGFRLSEVIRLEWSWVDRRRGMVEVRYTKSTSRREAAFDVIPLGRGARGVVEEIAAEREAAGLPLEGPVFLRPGGRALSIHLLRDVQRAAAAAGLQGVTFHAFRRTVGTRLARGGATPKAVQRALRHRRVEDTLQYYVMVEDGEVRVAFDRLPAGGGPDPGDGGPASGEPTPESSEGCGEDGR